MQQISFKEDSTKNRISLEAMLNPSQWEAVAFREGSILVIAGAGSGKTLTLTCRVASLVNEGILPRSILLLTFTRKAAQEMLRRATDLLDNRCEKVSGGTFHSFANTILRQYAAEMGFPNGYAIIDRTDAEDLIGMIRKEMNFSSKIRSFPTKKTLMDIFSRAANKVLSIEDIVFMEYVHFSSDIETIARIHREYRSRKILHGFVDYDDLLIDLRNLLYEHAEICDKISLSYQYIMVDEYQDTNKIQAEILYLLSTANKNVMVVGDDSQSIYAFRGANFKNIMEFPKVFPAAKIIRLEENYRSVQPILTLTNMIIDRAVEKYSKRLFTQKKEGSTPILINTADEKNQSLFVVQTIYELNKRGIPFNDMAILFRAGFHSFDLEIELGREGISFKKVGGFKFMESAHIKDVLAHLRVLSHPHDRLSWYRILSLIDNIGPQKAHMIYERIAGEQAGYLSLVNNKFPSHIEKHIDRLKQFFMLLHTKNLSVCELGEAVLKYYTPALKKKFDDYPKRAKDLEQLVVIMERYQSLVAFLTDMALEPPNTSSENRLETDVSTDDRLTLSTIHSAKGLEWHSIFIIWALDGRFPSIHAIDNEASLEEERRLMYVAATRAKENLFFIYPQDIYDRSAGMRLSRPTRFLDDIPDEILEKRSEGIRDWSYDI